MDAHANHENERPGLTITASMKFSKQWFRMLVGIRAPQLDTGSTPDLVHELLCASRKHKSCRTLMIFANASSCFNHMILCCACAGCLYLQPSIYRQGGLQWKDRCRLCADRCLCTVFARTYANAYIHTHIYDHMPTDACLCLCKQVLMHYIAWKYACIMHTCIRTYIHAYIHGFRLCANRCLCTILHGSMHA
jgi:hypothetical protein